MKSVHVVPHIDQEAAGPSYSVPRLCESLAARGHEVELSCLAARGKLPGVVLDLHEQWPILGRFAISPSLARALRDKAGRVDIVHNHSLWSMVNVAAGWVVPGKRAKLVTSPRGTLSPWALLLRETLEVGRIEIERRQRLASWSRCLGGDSGATYLHDIFAHCDGLAVRPSPPWDDKAATNLNGLKTTIRNISR